jgi:hypothetical protein
MRRHTERPIQVFQLRVPWFKNLLERFENVSMDMK